MWTGTTTSESSYRAIFNVDIPEEGTGAITAARDEFRVIVIDADVEYGIAVGGVFLDGFCSYSRRF